MARSPLDKRLAPVTLVLGGARSGKSQFAEQLVLGELDRRGFNHAVYVATSANRDADDEMRARVRLHQNRRGAQWRTIEEPIDLAGVLMGEHNGPVLVDCLTLWASNLMMAGVDIESRTKNLCTALSHTKVPVVLVSNEVGLGIVPDNALARQFRDHAGRINQTVAQIAQRAYFIAAGLPLTLKDTIR